MDDPRLHLLQRRLFECGKRVQWTPAHMVMVARYMGFTNLDIERLRSSERRLPTEPSGVEKEEAATGRSYTFVISTAAVDRMGDTIAVNGWRLADYRKNPVVLWSHEGHRVPIGRATKVWVEGATLKATTVFTPAELNRQAEQVRLMLESRFLSATSVGFVPHKWKFSEDPARKYGIDFQDQELVEFSVVPVPANPEALIEVSDATKAKWAANARRNAEVERLKAYGT